MSVYWVCVCISVFLTSYVVFVCRAGACAIVCVRVACPVTHIFVGIGVCIGLYSEIYWICFFVFFLSCVSSVGACIRALFISAQVNGVITRLS
jgi:hypothetical protein